ncbi:head-tail connector protein [Phocaeicola paurosaccharolyticus]|uniref:head-tail connector protein n=1 Tax=Phocaeicola paurosaccharolyticus TaxID=732242 RepID=UPI00054E900C|nr:head-tail connector protein [Phocaeicola paurosaccharolyticus]
MIDLSVIKKHLQIDEEVTTENEYLNMLDSVATDAVMNHLNIASWDELMNEGGMIPAPIQQAILLLIGNLYKNREPAGDKSAVKIPYTFDYLIDLYKKY